MRVKFKGNEYNTTSRGTLGAVQFERKYNISYADAFNEMGNPRMEHMTFLAYSELQADGVEVGPFDDAFFAELSFLPPTTEDLAAAGAEAAVPLAPEVQPG